MKMKKRPRPSISALIIASSIAAVCVVGSPPGNTATAKRPAKTKAARKTSSVTATTAIPKRTATTTPPAVSKKVTTNSAIDLSRCSYASTAELAAIVDSPLVLDTSTGDAGSNTHIVNDTFEQCVFNLQEPMDNRSRVQIVLHVKRNGRQIHEELLSGLYSSPCPAECFKIEGLGDSAVVSPRFGDGGGFTAGAWAHLHVLQGSTRVYVAIAPADTSVNNGTEYTHASELDPAQVNRAVKIAKLVLLVI